MQVLGSGCISGLGMSLTFLLPARLIPEIQSESQGFAWEKSWAGSDSLGELRCTGLCPSALRHQSDNKVRTRVTGHDSVSLLNWPQEPYLRDQGVDPKSRI